MNKLYDRIDWHNNTTPAINETNLNRMSKAVDDIDDRVVDIAGTMMETVPQIQEDLEEAQELLEDAQEISTHPPIIGQNGNWWTWDTATDAYVDSGVDAGVSLTIGTTSTLTPGSDATVTNSGTATDPILNFGIPAGVAGQNGQDGADGADGVSPTVTIGTITGGHSVTITDADHPTGQSFNVMDGEDGVGIPSGGTTGQVLAKASGTDYDTEWINASGGSGGHTILNGSGTAMTQRTGLQFDGLNVTDDSGNDKTVVKSPIFNGTTEQWEALSSIEKAKYTVVNLTDDYGNDWTYLGTLENTSTELTLPANYGDIYICANIKGAGVATGSIDDIYMPKPEFQRRITQAQSEGLYSYISFILASTFVHSAYAYKFSVTSISISYTMSTRKFKLGTVSKYDPTNGNVVDLTNYQVSVYYKEL